MELIICAGIMGFLVYETIEYGKCVTSMLMQIKYGLVKERV